MKHIQDLGEYLEERAGEDPVTVECWTCRGKGNVYTVSLGKRATCRRCNGRGVLKTEDL